MQVTNPDVERDRVAAQDPRPSTRAPEGSTVTITVSTGPGEATVPPLAGLRLEQAESRLREAGFKPRVEREFSDTVPPHRVIDTSPPPGTSIERGSTVTVRVSRGTEQVEIPDVVGQSEDNARSALEGAGLRAGEVTEQESDEPPGTVIEQSPAAGTQLAKGLPVALVVAQAAAVPDVVDMTEDEARAALGDAGFDVRVRAQAVTSEDEVGIVLEQDPAGGEARPLGTRVRIFVGRAPEPTPTPTPSPTATAQP